MVSVAAVDLATGRRFERDGHAVMPAASTIKVLVSAALWTAVERGGIDAGQRVTVAATPAPGGGGLLESMDARTALTLAELDLPMLAVSDNAATNVLIDVVSVAAVNHLASELGLSQTRLRRSMMDAAAARGDDNTTCAADMVALLSALARADGKQGALETVRHDVGLIEEGGRRVALAVLSAPPADANGLVRVAAIAHAQVAAD